MKPISIIPIGLVTLTLASIVLTLLAFWLFHDSGLGAGSDMKRPDGDGSVDALSPGVFVVFLFSLLAAYWVGRQSGRLKSAWSERDREQLVDPSFLRAKASLEAAAATQQSSIRTRDWAAGEQPSREYRPDKNVFDHTRPR